MSDAVEAVLAKALVGQAERSLADRGRVLERASPGGRDGPDARHDRHVSAERRPELAGARDPTERSGRRSGERADGRRELGAVVPTVHLVLGVALGALDSNRRASSSKAGLFAALGIGALAAIGGAVYFHGASSAPASAPVATTATAPSASAASASAVASAAAGPGDPAHVPAGHDRDPRRQLLHGQRRGAALREARAPGHAAAVLHRRVRGHRRALPVLQRGGSLQARRNDERVGHDHRQGAQGVRPALQHPRPGGAREASGQLRRLGDGARSSAASRAAGSRPRPSGSSPRADPTGASTRGATTTPPPTTSTRAARSASRGARSTASKRRACTTRTTASRTPRRSAASRRARRATACKTSSATSGSGSPTGTATTARTSRRTPKGPESGDEKVIRGGSWNGSYASWVRPTFRYKDAPTKRSYGIGFRCAK